MDRQAIIAKLRENEAALKARGVSHAALFGTPAARAGREATLTSLSRSNRVSRWTCSSTSASCTKGFIEGLSYEQFPLEIISEASRRLPDGLREQHPNLPWRSTRDVGNIYRHEYDNVWTPIFGRQCRIIFRHLRMPSR
jgi:hypothetical protein